MTILVAPDKFKGSLDSFEVCAIISKVLQVKKNVLVKSFPFADGGDGFAAVMKYYQQLETVECKVVDPLGREINATYEWKDTDKTAIIEVAAAGGLVLLKPAEQNPLYTSTYGTGLMIRHAIGKGAQKIVLGLGGSATNDAGTGILSALNFQFLDENNQLIPPAGKNLIQIKQIVPPAEMPSVQFEIACDVKNTLHGPCGAACVYGPQKGADAAAIQVLDKGLEHFAELIERQTGREVSQLPGAGAAGGIAAGLLGFFDITMHRGVELIAAASDIEKWVVQADLLITGEGRIDTQSREGKVTGFIASLAKEYHIPCVAICGSSTLTNEEAAIMGFQKIITLRDETISTPEAIAHAAELLEERVSALL